jgi:hypothetical protein
MKNIFLPVESFFADDYISNCLLVSGQIASVENTPNDFQKLTHLGDRIHEVSFDFHTMFVVDGEGKRPFGK